MSLSQKSTWILIYYGLRQTIFFQPYIFLQLFYLISRDARRRLVVEASDGRTGVAYNDWILEQAFGFLQNRMSRVQVLLLL